MVNLKQDSPKLYEFLSDLYDKEKYLFKNYNELSSEEVNTRNELFTSYFIAKRPKEYYGRFPDKTLHGFVCDILFRELEKEDFIKTCWFYLEENYQYIRDLSTMDDIMEYEYVDQGGYV